MLNYLLLYFKCASKNYFFRYRWLTKVFIYFLTLATD